MKTRYEKIVLEGDDGIVFMVDDNHKNIVIRAQKLESITIEKNDEVLDNLEEKSNSSNIKD